MKQILSCRVEIEIVSYNEREIIMVNKITLLRMKKICWKLKKEKAFDEATSISINTKGAGERYALNMLVEKNIVIKTETGKVYLKQQ